MNILDEFINIFKIDSSSISERIKVLEITSQCHGENLPSIDAIRTLLAKFPHRDEVKLTMINIYDDAVILNNRNDNVLGKDINEFYQESVDENKIKVELEIKKNTVNNVISVYRFDEFSKHIIEKNLLQIINTFHQLLLNQEYLIFEVFDSNILFSTNTMIFKSYPANTVENRFNRLEKIDICNNVSSFYNISDYKLIPEDFEVKSSNNNIFEPIFLKLKTLFSMIYISNTSMIIDSKILLEILGQRKVNFTYNINSEIVKNDELYKIYSWIATDGNAIDKAIIARNIISLHCQYTDIIKTDQKTFSSIQSNFRLYQKDNVGQYIELKNKVGGFILNIVNDTSDIVIGLVDKVKKNMMACFTFLLTVVIANIVSDQPLDNIFTKDITCILEFIILGSFIYTFISNIEIDYKLKKIKEGYNDLKQNYDNVLDEKDLNEIFKDNKVFDKNTKEAKSKIKKINLIWRVILLACLLSIELISGNPIILPILNILLELIINKLNIITYHI